MEISLGQVGIFLTVIVNIMFTVFYGGRLVERVEGHEKRISKLEG